MRRTIMIALVAALAMAVGVNVTAAAADGGTQAAAKKKAAKCPAKPKGKKKAGKSLADSAAKKKAACKPKKKAKPKAGAFELTDGTYEDTEATTRLEVTGGGKTAKLSTELSCFVYTSLDVPLTISGNTASASEDRDLVVLGEPAHVSWSLTVKSTLDFALRISWDVGSGICKADKTADGKFVKTS